MIPGKTYTFEDVLRATWRRKWSIVVTAAVVFLAAVATIAYWPPRYRSEALVQWLERDPSEELVRPGPNSPDEVVPGDGKMLSLGRDVMTRARLARVIVDCGLYPDLRAVATPANLVDRMRKDVVFEPVDRKTFRVAFLAADGETARRSADRLTRLFTEDDGRDRQAQITSARDFLERQVEEARTRLAEQEKKVEAYRLLYVHELPSQVEVNLRAKDDAERQLQVLLEADNRDRNQALYLQRQMNQPVFDLPLVPPTGTNTGNDWPVTASATAVERLEAARTALRAMELRLKPEHPEVDRQRRLIERLEKDAEAEARPGNDTATLRPRTAAEIQRRTRQQDLQAQIELLTRQVATRQADERRLQAAIAGYRANIDGAPRRESELTGLTRDNETQRKVYADLLAKREDAAMKAELGRLGIGQRFKLLDPPRLPLSPESPDRRLLTMLGALGALVVGFGLAAVLEIRDSSVRTDEDVALSLGLPVLATIPVLSERRWGA